MYKGIGNKCGIQIGKVYKYDQPNIEVKEEKGDPKEELDSFLISLDKTIKDINNLKDKAKSLFKENELAIFDAYLTMVNDPDYIGKIKEYINKGYKATYSCKLAFKDMVSMFSDVKDEYFNERINDIKHIETMLTCNLMNIDMSDLSLLDKGVIVVSKELRPQDTAQMNKDKVLGFILEKGSKTSHAYILASSLSIPSVVSIENIFDLIKDNDEVIIDSENDEVIINPDENTKNEYLIKKQEYENNRKELNSLINLKTQTIDDHQIILGANIGSNSDVDAAIKNGAEAIGLFRTEFIFINSNISIPSEDEQFRIYKEVLEKMNNKKVIIRTLDVGGDKELDYLNIEYDKDGMYSAVDYYFKNEEIFRSQIRALLKASAYGNLSIMFPMISRIEEFLKAKEYVLKQKEELIKEGIKVSDVKIGMMVETPDAADNALEFGKYADFFSIGTNDLIMYTLKKDRLKCSNTSNDLLDPRVLKLVKMAINGAHLNNIKCGLCGELAHETANTELLLGLGIDSLSMSSNRILTIKGKIRSLSYKDGKLKADELLKKDA